MTKCRFLALAAAVAMIPAFVCAQDPDQPGQGPAEAPVERPVVPLSFDLEVKYVTAYYSRGYNYGEDMLLLQPQATVIYEAYADEQLSITPWFNAWANITDEEYHGMDYWDELDLTPGVDIGYDRFTLSLQYIYYTSPADGWGDIHEVGASLSYDDQLCELDNCLGINPYIAAYTEFEDKDGPEGSYGEIGIKPQYIPTEDLPLSLSFPVALGLNIDDFYWDEDGDEETIGFWSAGIVGRYDINDNWYATAGVKYVKLVADSTEASNGGNDDDIIGSVSLGVTF